MAVLGVVSRHALVRAGLASTLRPLPPDWTLRAAGTVEAVVPVATLLLLDVTRTDESQWPVLRAAVDGVPVVVTGIEPDEVLHEAASVIGTIGVLPGSLPGPELRQRLLRLLPSDVHPTAGPELSVRELQILAQIAAGASNYEIAERLFLSVNTVKTYVRSAYRKMGVSNRANAVLWVLERFGPEGPVLASIHQDEEQATEA